MSQIEDTPGNREKMMKVADAIVGTCGSLDDAIEKEFGEDCDLMSCDIELLRYLDDQVMECQGCNWWCETSELDDDQLCDDCAPIPDDDGDIDA